MEMVSKIYYFSGTGNSLDIAKDISGKLGNSKLIPMTQLMQSSSHEILIQGDIIGFIFPVYFGRVPAIVEEFLDRAIITEHNYVFAVANGGGLFCRTLKIFNRILNRKNVKVNAGFTIRMPGNHPKVNQFIKKSNEQLFAEKEIRIERLCLIVRDKKNTAMETNLGFLGLILTHFVFRKPYNESKKHNLDRIMWTNPSCDKCGLCSDICPVQNIKINPTGPKWLGRCINCTRCYHLCPQRAIELGNDSMQRYMNPHVPMEELTEFQNQVII